MTIKYNNFENLRKKLIDGDRREVTILFADIKGFTKFSSTVDSEELHFIIDKLMQQFSNTIKLYNGYIDKYEGDMVMALFGAKEISENDMENAIDSAIVMLQQLSEFNKNLTEQMGFKGKGLEIRIGIDKGLVTTGKIGEKREGDFTVYGNAVNLAARLQQNAPTNRIMVSKQFKDMLSHVFEFQDYGTLSFKNVAEPIEVYLIKRPQKININNFVSTETIFIDRDEELATLNSIYDKIKLNMSMNEKNIVKNKPVLFGLFGEPGIGKTRLIYEFLNSKIDKGFIIQNDPPKSNQSPFSYLLSIIKRFLDINYDDTAELIESKLNRKYNEIALYLDNSAEKKELINSISSIAMILGIKNYVSKIQLRGRNLYHHINSAFRIFLESVATVANKKQEPLIIFLDDIHQMDNASFKAFEYIIQTLDVTRRRERKQERNYYIICSTRSPFAFSRKLINETSYHEIHLEPLTTKNSEKFIENIPSSNKISDANRLQLLENSKGNPFFIKEWVSYFLANNQTKSFDETELPSNISTLILSRIDKLCKEEKELLQKASVIGNEFLVDILIEIEQDMSSLKNKMYGYLKNLEKNGFIHKKLNSQFNIYEFSHKIVRKTAYSNLLRANRKILHSVIGNVIEKKYNDNLEEFYYDLVMHFEKGEDEKKLKIYLEKAAQYAKNRYDNENSIIFYDKLKKLANNQQSKLVFILLAEAEIFQLIGKWDSAEEVLQQALQIAKETNSKKTLADVISKSVSQFIIKGNLKKAKRYTNDAIEICNSLFEATEEKKEIYGIDIKKEVTEIRTIFAELYLNMGKIRVFNGEFSTAKNFFQKSLNESKIVNDQIGIARAYLNIGLVFESQVQFRKSLEYYTKAMNIFVESDFLQGLTKAYMKIGNLNEKLDEPDLAMKFFKQSHTLSEEIGDRENMANSLLAIGTVFDEKEDYDKAISLYKQALEIFTEMKYKIGIAHAVENIGSVYKKQKKLQKANAYFNKLTIIESIGSGSGIALTYERLGDIYIKKNNYSRAAKYYRKSLNLLSDIERKYDFASSLIDFDQNIDNVIDYYNRSQANINQLEDELIFAKEIRTIGETYLINKKYSRASKHLNTALSAFMEVNEIHEILDTQFLLVKVKYYSGDFNKATEFISRIEKISKRHNHIINDFSLNIFQLNIYIDNLDFEKAKKYVDELINHSVELGIKNRLAKLLLIKSQIQFYMNNISGASATCSTALRVASEENLINEHVSAEIFSALLEFSLKIDIKNVEKFQDKLKAFNENDIDLISLINLVKIFRLTNDKAKENSYNRKAQIKLKDKNTLISPQREEIYLSELDPD